MERSESISSPVDRLPVEGLLTALSESDIMALLGVTSEDLKLVHEDSDLLAMLRIAYEFLADLRGAGVLSTFWVLPKADQANFLQWIGMTADPQLRRARTRTFVSALEQSPLAGKAARA